MVEHALLDDLVGPPQHRLRDREPERLSGLEIDHEFELGWLLHWEITRRCLSFAKTLSDLVDERPMLPRHAKNAGGP